MFPVLPLPHLVFGPGSLTELPAELTLFGVQRPLLLSDHGLERVGVCDLALKYMPALSATYFNVAENPSVEDVDLAYAAFAKAGCDGIVALGGGSVIDTAKMVAALAGSEVSTAAALLGRPELIGLHPASLIAIPTTVGTGSESSPVAAIHVHAGGAVVGTRSPRMVPRGVICDPDLVRTLPPRLIAATGIDTLTHCLEGFLANPANPVVDALALDGLRRAFRSIAVAMQPGGDSARASLMAAAFMGGVAIHKGLGPIHAIALSCSDQGLHHGSLVAAALPRTMELMSQHLPEKTAELARTLDLSGPAALPNALRDLIASVGLPGSLTGAGYKVQSVPALVERVIASPFNRSSPYVPTPTEYHDLVQALVA